ncbi:hypothetical protein BD410DRAFT_846377 [Rickenella mellea]|uniref:Ribonuclease H1 N-terminal domain-containing protein n=1 Tax=Rickenella mellea TaxID=50990 RepID=A0A4Y7PG82_9AGAM|nr:hypothetical protein BD410DRAFT_846377 [Rickenella mellea]
MATTTKFVITTFIPQLSLPPTEKPSRIILMVDLRHRDVSQADDNGSEDGRTELDGNEHPPTRPPSRASRPQSRATTVNMNPVNANPLNGSDQWLILTITLLRSLLIALQAALVALAATPLFAPGALPDLLELPGRLPGDLTFGTNETDDDDDDDDDGNGPPPMAPPLFPFPRYGRTPAGLPPRAPPRYEPRTANTTHTPINPTTLVPPAAAANTATHVPPPAVQCAAPPPNANLAVPHFANVPPPPPPPQHVVPHFPPHHVGERFYAVYVGREVGIFTEWSDVAAVTVGVSGNSQRRFGSYAEALESFWNADQQGRVRVVQPPPAPVVPAPAQPATPCVPPGPSVPPYVPAPVVPAPAQPATGSCVPPGLTVPAPNPANVAAQNNNATNDDDHDDAGPSTLSETDDGWADIESAMKREDGDEN